MTFAESPSGQLFADMAPFLVANFFTIMFLASAYRYSRAERAGERGSSWDLLGMLVPLLVALAAAYARLG